MLLMSTKFLVQDLSWNYLSEMIRDWVKDLKNIDICRDDEEVLAGHSYEYRSEESGLLFRELVTTAGYGVEVITSNPDDGMMHILRCVLRELSQEKIGLSMQLHREMLNPSAYCSVKWHIPKVMKRIFWEEFGGSDNGLMTDNKSLLIRKDNLSLAKRIICREESYFNPIVYVSPYEDTGLYAVNYERLASDLLGMAHVVVEASPFVAKEVRKLTHDENPYNGACVVYLPNGEKFTFLPSSKGGKQNSDISKQIIEYVQSVMTATSVGVEFSFQNLLYEDLKSRVASSCGADSELEKLCEELLREKDNELAQVTEQLDVTKKELYVAQSQVESLKTALKGGRNQCDGITLQVTETDLYEGELQDVLLKLVQKEYRALCSDNRTKQSRKVHVLANILEQNELTGTDERLSDLLKVAVKTGTIDKRMKADLEKEGFEITNADNKHYKVCYKGDGRYVMAVSTTPSDHCAGENLHSAFSNMLFGY